MCIWRRNKGVGDILGHPQSESPCVKEEREEGGRERCFFVLFLGWIISAAAIAAAAATAAINERFECSLDDVAYH
jgi:hypothetical protein